MVWWRTGRPLSDDDAAAVLVIVLSARNQTHDKVRARRLGADDYLTKPFWPEELLERVRACLRRPTFERTGPIALGALRLDVAARELSRDGEAIAMTSTELDLLIALAQRPGQAVTRRWLAEHLLDPDRGQAVQSGSLSQGQRYRTSRAWLRSANAPAQYGRDVVAPVELPRMTRPCPTRA